jgi:hypothetical protein
MHAAQGFVAAGLSFDPVGIRLLFPIPDRAAELGPFLGFRVADELVLIGGERVGDARVARRASRRAW